MSRARTAGRREYDRDADQNRGPDHDPTIHQRSVPGPLVSSEVADPEKYDDPA